jgi:hypothetical protein
LSPIAKAELVIGIPLKTEEIVEVIRFLISEMGEVNIEFPEQLSRNAQNYLKPITPTTKYFRPCENVSLGITPANVNAVSVISFIYTDNTLWGAVRTQNITLDGLSPGFVSSQLVYAEKAVTVTGSGVCETEDDYIDVTVNVHLQPGFNIIGLTLKKGFLDTVLTYETSLMFLGTHYPRGINSE